MYDPNHPGIMWNDPVEDPSEWAIEGHGGVIHLWRQPPPRPKPDPRPQPSEQPRPIPGPVPGLQLPPAA